MIARYVAHALRAQVLGLATLAGVFVAARHERRTPARTVLHRDPGIEPLLGAAIDQYREDAVVESTADAKAFLRHVLPGIQGADQHALERIAQRYSLDQEPEDAHPDPFTRPTPHITGRQDDVVGYADAWARIEHYPRAPLLYSTQPATTCCSNKPMFVQPSPPTGSPAFAMTEENAEVPLLTPLVARGGAASG